MDCLIRREQAEYKREGVTCNHIVYPDNSAQIALIDDKKQGVFAYLDDECSVPKGTDANFVSRMHDAFDSKSALYSRPRFGAKAIGADLGRDMDKLQCVSWVRASTCGAGSLGSHRASWIPSALHIALCPRSHPRHLL